MDLFAKTLGPLALTSTLLLAACGDSHPQASAAPPAPKVSTAEVLRQPAERVDRAGPC